MSEPTQEMLEYLDGLRASGETNMYGAAPYLADEFGLSKQEARGVLAHWMKTFEARQAARADSINSADPRHEGI